MTSFSFTLTVPGAAPGPQNTLTLSLPSGQAAVTNYPLQFARPFLQGAVPSGFSPVVTIGGMAIPTQADIKQRYPDGSAKHAIIACIVPSIPVGANVTLGFACGPANNAPLAPAQMLAAGFDFDAALSVTGIAAGATTQTVSARAMLANGDYTLWTSGPIAQTIALGDDTAARKYDIGFGDGFHPLRPRFYVTFWPALNAVSVRVVAENDLASEIEDLSYKATVSLGVAVPAIVYSADLSGTQATHPKIHYAMTAWTQRFWHGYTEPAEVNIDHNLAYLTSTRFLPSYDTAITVSEAGLAAEYVLWSGKPHDIYDGSWDGGMWQNGMGVAGARQEIAPYPEWTVLWLYSGDWRMRQMALGMADLAGAFPAGLRESVAGKRLSRDDPAGSSTGLGHTISITDRPTIISSYLTYSYTKPADRVTIVGPLSVSTNWEYEGAHTPAAFYPQYLLTGDRWYLEEMYLWCGRSAAFYNGASSGVDGRGPNGSYGSILGQTYREGAWTIRNRAECAFIAPDSHPEKHYFTYLTNDALARYEGMFGITGTPFDGTVIKNFGVTTGDNFSANSGPLAQQHPPLGNMESAATPNGKDGSIVADVAGGVFATQDGTLTGTPIAGSFTAPWTHWYWQYSMGRLTELGFAAGPLRQLSGSWPVGMILDSGYPHLIGMYETPVELNALNPTTGKMSVPPGGYLATWSAVTGAITPQFLTGVGWPIGTGNGGSGDLDTYFAGNLTDDGRPIWLMGGLAMMVDNGDPRASAAWAWFVPHVYQAISPAALNGNPKWAIVPRSDTNVLPAIPTTIP